MTLNRILVVVLALDLFATLLVFRGMQILVDRADRLDCTAAVSAPAPRAPLANGTQGPAATPQADGGVRRSDVPNTGAGRSPVGAPADAAALPPLLSETEVSGMDDVEGLKSEFASQYGDSVWTAQVDQVFRDVVVGDSRLGSVTSEIVECKERVCKLTLAYADAAEFDEFVANFTMALEGDLSASLYFDEPNTVAGNSRVDVYLVREQTAGAIKP